MQSVVVGWLDNVGSMAFSLSAWAFVLLNGAGIALVAWKRDRDMVNRWTSRFLAVNLLLLGTGLGVPAVTMALRTAVVMLTPAVHLRATTTDAAEQAVTPVGAAVRP